jgi:hypothetical protein
VEADGTEFFSHDESRHEVCEAILMVGDEHSNTQAAVDLQRTSEPQREGAGSKTQIDGDLWKGLPRK